MINSIFKGDKLVWALVLVLFIISTGVLLFTSGSKDGVPYGVKNAILFLTGFALMVIFSRVSYISWSKNTTLATFLLAFVLIYATFFGIRLNGQVNWIRLGNIFFSISPIAHFAVLIYLAKAISNYQGNSENSKNSFLKIIVFPGLVNLWLIGFGNSSAAIITLFVSVLMLLIGGVKRKYVLGYITILLAVPIITGCVMLWNEGRLIEQLRILNARLANSQVSDQVESSIRAIKHGGLTGIINEANPFRTKIPRAQSHFIFSMIAENFGLIGILGVIVTYSIVLLRLCLVAINSGNRYAFLLVSGLVITIGLQFIIHFFVVTGLLPVVGIDMPMMPMLNISNLYFFVALGIALNISHGSMKNKLEIQS